MIIFYNIGILFWVLIFLIDGMDFGRYVFFFSFIFFLVINRRVIFSVFIRIKSKLMGSLKKIISVVNFWFFERREVVLLYVIVVVFVLVFELDLGGFVVGFKEFCKVVCWRLGEIFGVDVVVVLEFLLIVVDVWLRVELVGDLIDVNDVDFCFFIDVLVVSGVFFGGIFVKLFFIFVFVLLVLEILLVIFVLVLLFKGGEIEDGLYRNCVINSVKRGISKVVIWK